MGCRSEQTDLLSMLAGDDVSPAVPAPVAVEATHGPAERLFMPVQTMAGQLALGTDA